MDTIFIVVVVIGVVALGFLISAVWYRPRKGRFRVRRRGDRWFTFRTDFGEFTIDAANGRLILRARKGIETVPLSDIRRLDYRYREREAALGEALRGWDIWDMFRKYRDVVGWFEISAVLSDGKKLPMYTIGQYEPRELWSGWWFALEKALLAKVGLFTDVEERSRAVLKELQGAFLSRRPAVEPHLSREGGHSRVPAGRSASALSCREAGWQRGRPRVTMPRLVRPDLSGRMPIP